MFLNTGLIMRFLQQLWVWAGLSLLSGCAVVAVADLAVTTAATVVSTGVKATGAVIDAVIPDSKK
jgi:hypothetical protein